MTRRGGTGKRSGGARGRASRLHGILLALAGGGRSVPGRLPAGRRVLRRGGSGRDPGEAEVAMGALDIPARHAPGLPDGSLLELAIAPDQPEQAAGRVRYRGALRGGSWQTAEAWPTVSRETLGEALS
jgi:hypothetical protein